MQAKKSCLYGITLTSRLWPVGFLKTVAGSHGSDVDKWHLNSLNYS